MACLLGHKWNGCKCEKCGKQRNENHLWQSGKCSICGRIYTDFVNLENLEPSLRGTLQNLETRICSIQNPIARATTINNLPQEHLFFLAKNASNDVIRENTIKLIKDPSIIIPIILSEKSYSVIFGAMGALTREDIDNFINDSSNRVNNQANEKLIKAYEDRVKKWGR